MAGASTKAITATMCPPNVMLCDSRNAVAGTNVTALTDPKAAAAEALHITQPAISIQLKNFQQHFDIPLTEVLNKRLYVTDFGKEIALAAETILAEAEAMHHRTLAFKGELAGKLKISVVSTGKYVIPYFLAGFLKANPGVELQLDVTNKARVIKSLEKNEVDFSLVSVLPDSLLLNTIELMQNKLLLIGNPELWAEAAGNHEVLKTMPLIYREEGSATRSAMENFISKNNLIVKRKLVLTSNEAVKQAVIAGIGYSIMPLIGMKNELKNGELQVVPLKGPPVKTSWNLIWRADKKPNPVTAAYEAYIRKEKDAIISRKFAWSEAY